MPDDAKAAEARLWARLTDPCEAPETKLAGVLFAPDLRLVLAAAMPWVTRQERAHGR